MKIDKRSVRTWSMIGPTGLYGVVMHELAKKHGNLCVVTADLCSFSGLERFSREFPENFYNVGIAEQNMLGVAAGLAKEGMDVFAATYASFMTTRTLDWIKIHMGYMNLPIKLVGLTAGFASGILGATHMSLDDFSIMRTIPEMIVLSPADCTETVKCLEAAMNYSGPAYIRLTGTARTPIVYDQDYNYTIGEGNILKTGEDICILATGSLVRIALDAAKDLESAKISTSVIDVHTIKPFSNTIIQTARKHKLIVTAEEHNIHGGLASIVAEELALHRTHPPLLSIGTQGVYPHAASYSYLMEQSGLAKEKIVTKILQKYSEV